MINEYTFSMEETVLFQWTLTCQADTAEQARAIAENHMRSDVHHWARSCCPPPQKTIIAQVVNDAPLAAS